MPPHEPSDASAESVPSRAPDQSASPPQTDEPIPEEVDGLAKLLGMQIETLSPERVTASLEITPDHHQPAGYLHGGVSVSMGETVCSIGAYLAAPEGKAAFGMEINANHVRSKRAGTLRAEAEPLHVGRTSQVWGYRIMDEDERLVCTGRCTVAVVDAK